MRSIVFGATGFLGGHLVQALRQDGGDVVCVSRSGGPSVLADGTCLPTLGLDQLDRAAVSSAARGADVAYLCAGRVSRSAADSAEMHRMFVEGARAAVLALSDAGVRRAVLVSSSGTLALGRDAGRIYSEACPATLEDIARFPYYRAKYYGERAALEAAEGRIELVVANPSLLLGPRDLRESSTGDVRRFLDGSVSAVPAGGLAFVDVRDAARGLIQLAQLGRTGERYVLSAANMSIRAFFERLARMTGISSPRFTLPRQAEAALLMYDGYAALLRSLGGVPPIDRASIELGQHYFYCSAEKAEGEVGFRARDPGETLYDTARDLVERQVVVRPRGFRS